MKYGSYFSNKCEKKSLWNHQACCVRQPIEISSTKDGESVVIISKSDWNSLQETIYLQNAGVLDQIHHFENEESEDLGEIDWDTI